MDNFDCLICGSKFSSAKSLHLHIGRKEILSLEEYYHKFFPRYDLYSKELIKFSNRDKYFKSQFNSKDNLAAWFQKTESNLLKRSVVEVLLKNRIEEKKIKKAFTQSELRTSLSPSVITLENLFKDSGGYNRLCESLGLEIRFNYSDFSDINLNKIELPILIDSREQKPLEFSKSKIKQLNCGDYTADEPFYDDVYIERKSPEDFFGTLGNKLSFERFKREVERAEKFGFYLFVLVECPLNLIMSYNNKFANNSKATILCSLSNMRILCQNFNNIQFLFSNGRDHSSHLTNIILQNGKLSTQFDWQFIVDKKIC